MKALIFLVSFLSISLIASSQNTKMVQKSWLKVYVENLSPDRMAPDTLYTRYTFDKSKLYISFYPAWDDHLQEWSIKNNNLKIGFSNYEIEELTDTSLVIKLDGFRKYGFLSEDYLASQKKYLDSIGIYKGKTLYKANDVITPRYSKGKSLREVVQKNTGGYNIVEANWFYLTFVVTENGEVDNIQVLKGITEGFDKQIISQLQATSKHWKPATFNSRPIQTQMFYEIKYLGSIDY